MARDYANRPARLNELVDSFGRSGTAATVRAMGLTGCNFDPYCIDTATALTDGTVK